MCDLIDLNSPDVRGVSDPAKLASPLIPAPKNDGCNSETSSSATEKYENLGNNPFDTVLHETAEYISKKGDPFEIMLQRAMKCKSRKNTEHLKAQSVEFMDDFTPKRKKRYQKMMNKSLDVLDTSLLENKLDLFNDNKKEHEKSVNMTKAIICDINVTENASASEKNEILATSPNLFELSLLDISALNDTLSDTCFNSKVNSDISSENALLKKFIFPSTSYLKPLDLKHSLSHKVERSPIKSAYLSKRSKSLTDGQKIVQSMSNTSSCLDRAFLESKLSAFSSLSNVSSITKLTSTSISSSMLSNDTMNHAFLDTDSLGRASQKKINTIENSEEIKVKQWDLSDLAEKLNKLKCAMNETSNILNATENESNSIKKEKNRPITNNKLIDVDVFIPEQSINKEYNRSSISIGSSDSNTDKAHKSIIKEAKALARTFEELALKTDSSSGTNDDFISNNTLWMSDLLPAFEDEPVVDNLIELPVSPEKSTEDSKNNSKKQSSVKIDNADENSLKDTSSELSASNIKQTIVTSLLSDLKKIVKTEDNPEANKLFNNLEKALNVNCKNNTELLITCLNISNELQSPQKTLSEDVERSEKTNTDKNKEKSEKIFDENCNNEKLSQDVNQKFENASESTAVNNNSSSIKSFSSCKDNYNENDLDINSSKENTSCTEEENNQTDEKLAIELLMSLGKLLSGQTEDATTMQLLKNIGKALNVVSNSSKIESKIQTNRKIRNVQQTSVKASDGMPYSTKTAHRRSLQLESKSKSLEKTNRKSTSGTDSLSKSASGTPIREHKDTSELNDRKCLSSDPSYLVNKKITKISESCNNRKAKVAQLDTKKEKSIAISDVKNKLKKKSEVINKKGPMKAVHPVDSMQKKRASVGKHTTSSSQNTPPKVDKSTPRSKIISSTPNSTDNNYYMPKKPTKSKPVASSTPDGHNSKILGAQIMSANKKRNISCEISPVTMHANTSSSDERKDSPKRVSKLPTPKKSTTPNRQGIPRYSPSPKHNSSFNVSHQQSPKRLNRSLTDYQRYSPSCQKKSGEKIQQSPFKESNRDTTKVKPYKLISKLRRHSTSEFVEKENNYV